MCVDECNRGTQFCVEAPYTSLDKIQQNAVKELRHGMQMAALPYQFPKNTFTDIFASLSANPANCKNRETGIDAQNKFIERTTPPVTCLATPKLPKSAPIWGTNLAFSYIWIDLLPNLDGVLTRTPGGAKVAFRLDILDASPKFTVKVDNPQMGDPTSLEDVIEGLNIVGAPNKPALMVMSGKNFACFAIEDVPPAN
jgi:hypothetical protein